MRPPRSCLPPGWSGAIGLDGGLEACQRAGPEVVEEGPDGLDRFRTERIEPARALASLAEQPGLPQHPQMLRDRLRGDVEVVGDLAGRPLTVTYEPQDATSARLREGPEHVVGREQLLGLRCHQGVRPMNATSRSVARASAATATSGPIRGARMSSVIAWRANASSCSARSASSVASWPVARARSQPWTSTSRVLKPLSAAPGMSPSGVGYVRASASSSVTASTPSTPVR